jgi:hypothetical protein
LIREVSLIPSTLPPDRNPFCYWFEINLGISNPYMKSSSLDVR